MVRWSTNRLSCIPLEAYSIYGHEVEKTETGDNEDLTVESKSKDVINNTVENMIAEGYLVTKSEIYITRNRSYRAYVLIAVKKSALGV